MADIKNIKFGALTPDKRMTLHNGTVTEVKRTYKVVDGQAVIVWDIGEEPIMIIVYNVAVKKCTVPPLENQQHEGSIDFGNGNYVKYFSNYSRQYTYKDGDIRKTTIKCEIVNIRPTAFKSLMSTINYIKLPQTVRTIGDEAFRSPYNSNYGGNIQIELNDGIETIGEKAFVYLNFYTKKNQDDEKLLELPDSIKEIGKQVFSTYAGANDFYKITNLPKSLEKLGVASFAGRNFMTDDLKIPDKVTEIPIDCFRNCGNTGTLDLNNVNIINSMAFALCNFKKIIFNSVKKICGNAFYSITGLTELNFNEGLEVIEKDSFYGGAKNVERIYFPSTLKVLDDGFATSKYKKNILQKELTTIVSDGNVLYWLSPNDLAEKSKVILPAVRTIAAYGCYSINTSTTAKNKLIYEECVIPDTVEYICYNAFDFPSTLKTLTVSNRLKYIGERAMHNAYSGDFGVDLNNVTITLPKTLEYIGTYAFNKGIETIYYTGTQEEWDKIEKAEKWDSGKERTIIYLG